MSGVANGKPCPWCQGRKLWLWRKTPTLVAVACSNPNCASSGPVAADEAGALELWNEAPRNSRAYVSPGLRPTRRIDRLLSEMHPPDAENDLMP